MSHFGDELRRLLAVQGVSLREAARRVPCDSGHLSKLASGRKRPSSAMAQRLDDVLEAGGALASLVPAPPAASQGQGEAAQPLPWVYGFGQDVSVATRRQFTAAFLAALGIAVSARRLAGGAHVGSPHVELVESVLGELDRTDAREGGDLVCDGAAALLDTVYDWLYAGSYGAATGNGLAEAAGQLGAWVGWTAYDADRFAMSRHYYQETLLLGRMNDDRPLEARVLSYMCLQAQRRGRPREAIGLAETALRVSSGWATPRLAALLHLRLARAHAGSQDAAGFRRQLAHAKNEFGNGASADDPPWIRSLTAAEVAGIEGMSYAALGKPERAAGQFRTALDMAEADFARNACYYQVRLAEALHEAGDVVGACETAAEAVPAVAAIRSSRTRNRLAALRLKATSANPAAREFADRYDEAFTG
jgi:transcriptional regulator with XRE-family HTH domain